jgi:COMM domain
MSVPSLAAFDWSVQHVVSSSTAEQVDTPLLRLQLFLTAGASRGRPCQQHCFPTDRLTPARVPDGGQTTPAESVTVELDRTQLEALLQRLSAAHEVRQPKCTSTHVVSAARAPATSIGARATTHLLHSSRAPRCTTVDWGPRARSRHSRLQAHADTSATIPAVLRVPLVQALTQASQ